MRGLSEASTPTYRWSMTTDVAGVDRRRRGRVGRRAGGRRRQVLARRARRRHRFAASSRAPRCSGSRRRTGPASAWCGTSGRASIRQAVLGAPPRDRRRRRAGCRRGSSGRASTSHGAPSCCSATSGTRSPPRCPSCVDAGALDLVGTHTAPTVITPHAGRARRPAHRAGGARDRRGGASRTRRLGRAGRSRTRRRRAPEGRRHARVRPRRRSLHRDGPHALARDRRQRRRARRHPRRARRDAPCAARGGCRRRSRRSPRPRRGCTARRLDARAPTVGGGPVTALDIAEAVPGVIGAAARALSGTRGSAGDLRAGRGARERSDRLSP